jgi:hypothetical protein
MKWVLLSLVFSYCTFILALALAMMTPTQAGPPGLHRLTPLGEDEMGALKPCPFYSRICFFSTTLNLSVFSLLSRDIMIDVGIACDGGKDSLSMAATAGTEVVMAPGNLVVSSYVGCPDITQVRT